MSSDDTTTAGAPSLHPRDEMTPCPWQRGVHVWHVPIFTRAFVFFLALSIIGVGLSVVRAFGGLDFTGMNDAYAWGIWKTFNVMTLTALGSGGFAIGIAAWVFGRHELHAVMRTALMTSLVFYLAGLLALTVDVGRPWNMWHLAFPSHWNTDSSLLEVAVCMPLYAVIFLAFENLPPVFERIFVHASDNLRAVMVRTMPIIKAIFPYMLAGAYVLPAMHQSSLGALLLLAGEKLDPLWQSQMLPLLYVIQAGVAGVACVMFTLMIASLYWQRPIDTRVLGSLGRLMSQCAMAFLIIRFADLAWRGVLGRALALDGLALVFHAENLLVGLPALVMFRRDWRERPRVLFVSAIFAGIGAMLYRFVPTTIAFVPGELKFYFPTFLELLMSAGYVALTVVLYSVAVKMLAIVPGSLDQWYGAVAYARRRFRTIRVDEHGQPSRH